MSFLDDIRRQPQGTREIMFGLSVFVTVLLISMIWFRSFQKNLYVLMNPEGDVEKALAVENAPVPSLFGYIGNSFADIKGLVSGFLGGDEKDVELKGFQGSVKENKVHTLPLSEHK